MLYGHILHAGVAVKPEAQSAGLPGEESGRIREHQGAGVLVPEPGGTQPGQELPQDERIAGCGVRKLGM